MRAANNSIKIKEINVSRFLVMFGSEEHYEMFNAGWSIKEEVILFLQNFVLILTAQAKSKHYRNRARTANPSRRLMFLFILSVYFTFRVSEEVKSGVN